MNVLIATHQRPELLARTLLSLEGAAPPVGVWKILVVENGGTRTSEETCASSPLPIEYRFLGVPGKSRALNLGLETIGTGLVLFLDDDVRVSPGILQAYQQASWEHGSQVIYGGPVLPEYETSPPPEWLRPFLPPSVRGFYPEPGEPFLGANFAAFAEVIRGAGGFDVRLGGGAGGSARDLDPVAEETELQMRLLSNNLWTLPVPDAQVWHFVPSDRCSPAWALNRIYRHGLSEGIRWAGNKTGPRLFGAPRWVWRSLVQSNLSWGVSFLRGKREEGFRHRFKSRHAWGLLRGSLQRPRDP